MFIMFDLCGLLSLVCKQLQKQYNYYVANQSS